VIVGERSIDVRDVKPEAVGDRACISTICLHQGVDATHRHPVTGNVWFVHQSSFYPLYRTRHLVVQLGVITYEPSLAALRSIGVRAAVPATSIALRCVSSRYDAVLIFPDVCGKNAGR
jgi:hypothetical protein